MEFRSYQHVERFGTSEVEGIELGNCYIFPKVDGSNAQVYLKDGVIKAGSRKRELTLEADNGGFYQWVLQQENIKQFLQNNPTLRLYGEWLIPHSLKTYREDAWRNLYVFDVIEEFDGGGFRYLPYTEYQTLMELYHINYIPPIALIHNVSYEHLTEQLEKNMFLIQDGKGFGEGIVIKNYDYKNKYGRTTWAKIVTSEFKEKHAKTIMKTDKANERKQMVEQAIADKYVTNALCEKVYAKIVNEKGEWNSKLIPMLLNMVYYDIVKEECWTFVKENRNPTINFSTLQTLVFKQVKERMNKIF